MLDHLSRLEVIDDEGRQLVYYGRVKDIAVQDQGRTVKIFLDKSMPLETPRKPVQGDLDLGLSAPREDSNPSVASNMGRLEGIGICSVEEIYEFLRYQGNIRSFENDEMDLLLGTAYDLREAADSLADYHGYTYQW